ncbi:hypothetical protein BDA99DRAFT_418897, partial [Phascolomyces articulosus]
KRQPSFQEAAEFFQPPPDQQRFQYIHFPCRNRLPRKDIRRLYLRSLAINPNRIIDISSPARNVLSLLVHTQYFSNVFLILKKANTPILYNFNPTDPVHLRDPTYILLPEQQKSEIAAQCHRNRCLQTLNWLKHHVKHTVAYFFQHNGWVS